MTNTILDQKILEGFCTNWLERSKDLHKYVKKLEIKLLGINGLNVV